MNLLTEKWLPVRRRDGVRDWITPADIADASIVALDFDRADFNGAVIQLLIGLLHTAAPVERESQWSPLWRNPPSRNELERWFAPYQPAFEIDGDDRRFMQDAGLKKACELNKDIGSLLIEAPGENTIKHNADHFVSRNRIAGLCATCAVTALLTLQTNGPAGGVGYRTGVRGGGPLTTLLLSDPPNDLWHDLWLNVLPKVSLFACGGDPQKTAGHFSFPWLADLCKLQKDGGGLSPVQTHPCHVFFAMPRRIWLDFSDTRAGECDLCHRESPELLARYAEKNYGLNYKGPWEHPLSPYYESKEGWLPLHPQPGGLGYRHWLAWICGVSSDRKKQRRAAVVRHFFEERTRTLRGRFRLWAFGYDVENAKARCWYEAVVPLYALAECDSSAREQVQHCVARWLDAAELGVSYLRTAVKEARCGTDVRGDWSVVDAVFWDRTAGSFYAQLRALIDAARAGEEYDEHAANEAWFGVLTVAALHIFDRQLVGTGVVERENPKRIAQAYQSLKAKFRGPKIRQALGLPLRAASKSDGDATTALEAK